MNLDKQKLRQIFQKFGIKAQTRKFAEESYELQEQLHKDHINIEKVKEEMADCIVLLKQFQLLFTITDEELEKECEKKINRTIERIKMNYY